MAYNPHTWLHEEIIYANLLNNMERGIQTNSTDISNEIQNRINDVDAEELRAKGVEQTLQTGLSGEISRATGAEGILSTNLQNEITRASTAEGNLDTAITGENTRAMTAESNLSAAITAETNRATAAEALKVDTSSIGAANGVASLDANGLVPANQLPSYVDDVLEGIAGGVTQTAAGTYTATSFTLSGESSPCTPETGKTYVDVTSSIQYRWSGSIYVSMGSNLTLGTTEYTAFRGDYGNDAYQKRHEHSNKSILDGITQQDIDNWNTRSTVLTTTLYAGNTSITITNDVIGSANGIHLMTETGIAPLTQSISETTYTATFPEQEADMDVMIEVK